MEQETQLENLLKENYDKSIPSKFFCEALLGSTVHILGKGKNKFGKQEIAPGESVEIQCWSNNSGGKYIPFFSSVDELKRSVSGSEAYISLEAKSFFQLTLDQIVILNPRSNYGREFGINDVRQLLNNGKIENYRIGESLLSQPEIVPDGLIDAICEVFKHNKSVNRAHLVMVKGPSSLGETTLQVAIEAGENQGDLIKLTNEVIAKHANGTHNMSIKMVNKDDELFSQYLDQHSEPIYKRKFGLFF